MPLAHRCLSSSPAHSLNKMRIVGVKGSQEKTAKGLKGLMIRALRSARLVPALCR